MRKILGTIFLSLLMGSLASAQTTTTETKKSTVSKPSRDHFLIQLSNDRWTNVPDSIHTKNTGRGVGLYLMYDFPIKQSNFSFGAGLGVRFNNIFFDHQKVVLNGNSGSMMTFKNVDSFLFKGNKYTTTYLEFPLELRYFANKENRNRGFKFAIGAKVGFAGIGGAYYKDRESIAGKYVINKTGTKRYNQQWRLTPTARIGWGNFGAFVEYTPTPIFNANAGPDVRPLSFGIVISGL